MTGGWLVRIPTGREKYGGGGVAVQHSPTSSSMGEVSLSKAPEAPRLLTAPGVVTGSWMGQKQRKNFLQKTIKVNLT